MEQATLRKNYGTLLVINKSVKSLSRGCAFKFRIQLRRSGTIFTCKREMNSSHFYMSSILHVYKSFSGIPYKPIPSVVTFG